jgi:hypothetical protein
MTKTLKTLALALFTALSISGTAEAVTGAVFIHGKGGTDLANATTAYNYWGTPMLKAATKNWAVPYLVCHYDGTQYMWVAGGTVAGQITAWLAANPQITDIVINTHSFGGVVTRWIFSNPTYDSRYPTIISKTKWVNTIAGPHKGSEAANLAGTLSGSWLTGWITTLVGQNNDSTKNCQTSNMSYYNQYYLKGTSGRPALPKTFYTISGWGLWNDYWSKFHSEDIGLATLSGVAGMPGEDDGMVSEYSAQGIGTLWFRTEANHHHNRRNDYKTIGTSLGTDF